MEGFRGSCLVPGIKPRSGENFFYSPKFHPIWILLRCAASTPKEGPVTAGPESKHKARVPDISLKCQKEPPCVINKHSWCFSMAGAKAECGPAGKPGLEAILLSGWERSKEKPFWEEQRYDSMGNPKGRRWGNETLQRDGFQGHNSSATGQVCSHEPSTHRQEIQAVQEVRWEGACLVRSALVCAQAPPKVH